MLHFELTEIISGSAAQGLAELSLGIQIEACLKNYSRQQEFIQRYAGKQIWIEFFEYHGNESGLKAKKRKVTRKVILGAANRLFDLLLADKNRGKTKIHPFCPHDTNLAKILAEALVHERPVYDPTLFETGGAIPFEPVDELLLRKIISKCSRRYSRSGIHLLAYFDFQPPDFRSDWEKRLTRLCKKFSGKSQFNICGCFQRQETQSFTSTQQRRLLTENGISEYKSRRFAMDATRKLTLPCPVGP